MRQQRSCPNGHQWEGPAETAGTGELAIATCPVCGYADATNHVRAPETSTLHPPPRAAPDETLARTGPPRAVNLRPRPPREASEPSTPLPPERGEKSAPTSAPLGETLAPPPSSPTAGQAGTGCASGAALPTARDEYEILGLLGKGGMGVVYKARHKALNRLTALKMILAGNHADEADMARFRAEAEAVARLQHPNIVQIYEVGQRDGRPYFSLELVEGGSLDHQLQATPLSHRQAAELIETLARAVHYAHQRGVIHRDLKPANILLAADGTPKISDFGLAKRLDDDSGQTGTGTVLGTPAYMSPEQAVGRGKDASPATDVYALGAILYDCLTGRPPFRGDSVIETLQLVRYADPVPPRRVQPSVPRDLDTICLKCLAKEPRKRYESALELADDLRRFLDDQPIRARPVGVVERAVKWAKRRPGVAALLATLAVVIAGSLGGLLALWLHAESERAEADAQRQAADDARRTAQQNYRSARRFLYASHMSQAQQAVRDGHRERLRELLAEMQRRGPGAEDLRGFEWYYLSQLSRRGVLCLRGHTNLVTHVAFSPDGKTLATASLDRTVRLWHAADGTERLVIKGYRRPVRQLAFRPDGQVLAAAGADGTVKLFDAQNGKQLGSVDAHPHGATAVAFSPDGTRLASAGEDEAVKVWDLRQGAQPLVVLEGHRYPAQGVAFSPDGKTLASAGEDRTVRLWDLQTGKELFTLKGHTHWALSVAFSPDGKTLASGGWDQVVRLWDLQTRQALRVLPGHARPINSLGFSPTGGQLASASTDGTVCLWDLEGNGEPKVFEGQEGVVRTVAFGPDGKLFASVSFDRKVSDQTPTFTGHRSPVLSVVFAPGGKYVASAGGTLDEHNHHATGEVKVWEVATRKVVQTLRGHAGIIHSVDCDPAGRRWATGGEDQTVRLWDAQTGKELHVLTGHDSRVTEVRFSADGRLLVSAGGDTTVRVWDAATGKQLQVCQGHLRGVRGVAFSPDGQTLASAGADGVVVLWDVGTGQRRALLKGHEYAVQGVMFSPDGKLLASGSEDQTVRLWDVATGKELRLLRGHSDEVTSVAFSPDGKRVASGSEDQTVKLWDVQSGEEVLTLSGHTHQVYAVAFSPDGTRLASASGDQTVRLWEALREENEEGK